MPGQSGVPLIGKKSAVFRVNLELDTKMLRTSILLILSRDGHKEFFFPTVGAVMVQRSDCYFLLVYRNFFNVGTNIFQRRILVKGGLARSD